ncbi:hypothetical protein GCM10010430_60000 [Kitasatospora cystarginea]|uniref:Uncharacterized protein n=1 Tax=Kitasatospora cystarginea TaxID=58350 RepID=A0ABP5RMA8_9ACTN
MDRLRAAAGSTAAGAPRAAGLRRACPQARPKANQTLAPNPHEDSVSTHEIPALRLPDGTALKPPAPGTNYIVHPDARRARIPLPGRAGTAEPARDVASGRQPHSKERGRPMAAGRGGGSC